MSNTIIFITMLVLGAFLNRVRGGLRIPFTDKKFPLCKWWINIVYGLFLGWQLQVDPYITFISLALVNGLAMWLGHQMFGWGAYVGSLVKGTPIDHEVEFIDSKLALMKVTFNYPGKYTVNILKKLHLVPQNTQYDVVKIILKLENFPRVWGFFGLALRGLVWTFLLGLALYDFPIMILGVVMPVCYLIPTLLEPYFNKKKEGKWAWNIGEWIFGATVYGFVAYRVLTQSDVLTNINYLSLS